MKFLEEVIMYVVPLWPHCTRARRFLSGKGIKWVEKNILFSKARKEMQEVTDVLTVPVVRAGNHILVGFSLSAYEEAFKD